MTGPASSRPPILRCLSNGKYALMEGGFFPNYATGWMQRVGAGWLAWDLSESPVWLGVGSYQQTHPPCDSSSTFDHMSPADAILSS